MQLLKKVLSCVEIVPTGYIFIYSGFDGVGMGSQIVTYVRWLIKFACLYAVSNGL